MADSPETAAPDLEREREDLLALVETVVEPDLRRNIEIAVSALDLQTLPSYEITCEGASGAIKG